MAADALDGKVALVTGAGRRRGIGRATAMALADLGADVVVTGTGRDPSTYPEDEKQAGWRDVESTAEDIRSRGRRALTWVGDVSQTEAVDRLAEPAPRRSDDSTSSSTTRLIRAATIACRCRSWTRPSGAACSTSS